MKKVSSPALTEYSKDLFVNREKEISLVLGEATRLALGEAVQKRTIAFWGYKGTGRTWLLHRLTELLEEMEGVKPVYVNLDRYIDEPITDASIKPIKKAVRALLAQVARDIWGQHSTQASLYTDADDIPLSTLTAWFINDLQILTEQRVFVLLLDHAFEADWRFLAELEEHLLALLAIQPRVLLVMTGRGQAYHWKTRELRLYLQDYHPGPFDEDWTEKQLEKQRPNAVSRTPEIYELSQGYLLGNYLLAAQPTVRAGMQETVDSLLEGVPAEERSWLEAVCILRTFDEERLPPLLAAYFDDPTILQWPYKEIRQRRDRLQQTRMIRWNEKAGGWEVDQAIRPILERYMKETKLDVWRRLHCAAYRVYREWEQAYPDEKQRWQDEVEHHAKCLSDAGYNPEECL